MPTYEVKVDKDVLNRIAVAEAMHNFVLQAVPQRFKTDTDEKTIIVALFSLVVEHQGTILTLLKMGRLDGSAFALVRPLIDAVYRAFWVHFCAKPEHLIAIRNGEGPYPGLPNMADEVENTELHGWSLYGVEAACQGLAWLHAWWTWTVGTTL